MADLDRLEQDLGFVRRTIDGAGPRSPVTLYFLWAAISFAGFVLMDVNEQRVGLYWMIAAPAGSVLSAFLGWRDSRQSGAMDLADGLRHMQHWGAMMGVIFLTVFLAGRGVITWDALGPMILLILALSYFHAGLYLDPPLRWVGLLMVGGYFAVMAIDAYAWTIVGVFLSGALILVGIRESRRRGVAAA